MSDLLHERILRDIRAAVAATSDVAVGRALTVLFKGGGVPPELEAHSDAVVRMVWLAGVRAPFIWKALVAGVMMRLSLIEAGAAKVEELCEVLADAEGFAANGTQLPGGGFTEYATAASLGPRIATLSGPELLAVVRGALDELRSDPAKFEAILEQAAAGVVKSAEEAVDEGAFDDVMGGTPREKSNRWIERGLERNRSGDLEGALDAFDAALEQDATNARALIFRAEALDGLNDGGAAQQDFEAAIRLNDDAFAYAAYGSFLMKHEQFEGAFSVLSAAIQRDGNEALARLNRGALFRFAGKLAEARADLDIAAQQAPRLHSAWNNLGHVAHDEQKWAEAERHFTQALSVFPGNFEALYGRACVRPQLGDAQGAKEDLEAARPNSRLENDRLYDQARFKGLLGNIEGSIRDYDAALALNPKDVQCHINKGVMLQQANRLDEAMATFNAAVEANPDYPNAWVKRGMLHFLKGDPQAKQDLQTALSKAPPDWPSRADVEGVLQMMNG